MTTRRDGDGSPLPPFTRREFLVTALATGFAAAVRPTLVAAAITTDEAGIVAHPVKIPVRGGTIPGYRAFPAQR